jgi:hypothetical protein
VITHVVNISRGSVCDVYIGRRLLADRVVGAKDGLDGYFGNPYHLGTREECIRRFREYFAHRIVEDGIFRQRVLALRGKRLGCFCAPRSCHGDVYVQWLETHDS